MEYWDLYNKKREKINKTVKRGDKLRDDEYHLVVNVWIKNSDNEFLITQRSPNKSFPYMWECTGGSALRGETSLEAAIREVKEELGITLNKEDARLIGTKLRHYPNCPDILDVWVFNANLSIEEVVYQEEEICNAMWASAEKIRDLYAEKKFEANAFFEEALADAKEKVYYIGFNANNAICNESFFDGSITLYPTKEKGNRYFSSKLLSDVKSPKFLDEYKAFIYKTAKEIQSANSNSKFICFNKRIRDLCENMDDLSIIKGNDGEVLDFLNNKFKTREFLKDCVPMLDYFWIKDDTLSYNDIKEKLSCDKFVVQAETGSGGDNTYLINSQDILDEIANKNVNYCISKYVKNTPLNATLIIGEYETICLPISVQLILLTDNKFKYVGGDFIHAQSLSKEVFEKVNNYSRKIAEEVKKMEYRGILGIDYILCEEDQILFMEINPRFQASSFLISRYLEEYCNTNVAELHYLAMTKESIEIVESPEIDSCFVNCNAKQKFEKLKGAKIINNGYFEPNKSSVYRKVFNYSIFYDETFEKYN